MSLDLRPGAVFAGDFRVIRPLSEGGMGSVYVVEQLSTGAQRALKLMRRELVADASLRDRFLQEARVGSRIASDHVVQVIAAGVDPSSNVPWLVMELLQGEEVADRVKRAGPLSPAEVAEVAKQLGHALAAAHAVGVVHRDLKPNNLFLAASRTAGAPFSLKVLDFGIAKIVADAKTTGTVGLGTPLWMAPEQTESKSYVGPGTDVWALGLIVFFLLTGKSFWMAAAQPATGIQTLLREILFEPIVPPSRRAADLGVGHLLPQGFDAWFLRCVERDPAKRETQVQRALEGLVALLAAPTVAPYAPTGHAAAGHSGAPPAPHAGASQPLGTVAAAPLAYGAASPQPVQAAWGPTHAPLTTTTSGGPQPTRRSAAGAIAVVGALALLGGGAGAYYAFFADDEKKKTSEKKRRSSRNDDDDDDDDDGKPKTSDKDADCAALVALVKETETDAEAAMQDPRLDDLQKAEATAAALEAIIRKGKAMDMKTAEGRGFLARYSAILDDMAKATRAVVAAARSGDADSQMEEAEKLQKATAAAEKLEADFRETCGWVGL